MFGYIVTPEGDQALEIFRTIDEERVRYAASLTNGFGLVAWDDSIVGITIPSGSMVHIVHVQQEPIPEYPDTWPTPKKIAPKRAVATGREHFAFVSTDLRPMAEESEAVTGLVDFGNGLMLVESDGPVVSGLAWTAGVREYLDRRLVSV